MTGQKEHPAPRPSMRMDDPLADRIAERNAFLESLAPEAKERFLEALQAATTRGLDEEIAWREAVIAAETTYSADRPETNL